MPIQNPNAHGAPDIHDHLLLGVDGGGSKTRALLADRSGGVLAVGSAGSSNYQAVGFEAAAREIQVSVEGALAQLVAQNRQASPIGAACLGLAGAGRPADQARFEAWAREALPTRCIAVVNDAELLLAAGTPEGWGLALICGTGSICCGRAADGRIARAGGWGYLLGDEGSGYDIGREALRLATQTADGRAGARAILHAVLQHWELSDPAQLIGRLYSRSSVRAEVAALAEPIVSLARKGDLDAQGIIERAASELARLVDAVARTLAFVQPPIALGGGLLVAASGVRQALLRRIHGRVGAATVVHDSAQGALVIARRKHEECYGIVA